MVLEREKHNSTMHSGQKKWTKNAERRTPAYDTAYLEVWKDPHLLCTTYVAEIS